MVRIWQAIPGVMMGNKYAVGQMMQQVSAILNLDTGRVLARAGLSPSLAEDPDFSVGSDVYFSLWDAMIIEADRPSIVMDLAMAYAHGPFLPPIFAFSCADTLALGLERLSVFKPLIGPMVFSVTRPEGKVRMSIKALDPAVELPASLGLFELLYITECARVFSGTKVTPVEMTVTAPVAMDEATENLLQKAPKVTGDLTLTFSAEDADLPLITRSQSLWETLEPDLLEQLETQSGSATMTGRIKQALTEALPGGSASVENMARKLNISKRSLQRRLSEEGTSFQGILSDVRHNMAIRYLKESGLSIPEISYLLGFRDTSSFFRAFQGWTGSTPGDYRATDTAMH